MKKTGDNPVFLNYANVTITISIHIRLATDDREVRHSRCYYYTTNRAKSQYLLIKKIDLLFYKRYNRPYDSRSKQSADRRNYRHFYLIPVFCDLLIGFYVYLCKLTLDV